MIILHFHCLFYYLVHASVHDMFFSFTDAALFLVSTKSHDFLRGSTRSSLHTAHALSKSDKMKSNSLRMLRKMAFHRGHDSWCWPNWARPLGSLNRPVATHAYPKFTDRGSPPDEWVRPCLSVCLIRPTAVIKLRDQVNILHTPVKQDLNRTWNAARHHPLSLVIT